MGGSFAGSPRWNMPARMRGSPAGPAARAGDRSVILSKFRGEIGLRRAHALGALVVFELSGRGAGLAALPMYAETLGVLDTLG